MNKYRTYHTHEPFIFRILGTGAAGVGLVILINIVLALLLLGCGTAVVVGVLRFFGVV